MGKTALNADGVKALATMPSLDELRAKLVGLIQAPGDQDRPALHRAGRQARPRVRSLCQERRGLRGPSSNLIRNQIQRDATNG